MTLVLKEKNLGGGDPIEKTSGGYSLETRNSNLLWVGLRKVHMSGPVCVL